jgi:hypothetical protein
MVYPCAVKSGDGQVDGRPAAAMNSCVVVHKNTFADSAGFHEIAPLKKKLGQ